MIEAGLHEARQALQAGGLQQAEAAYTAVLSAQPDHPEANHNLSLILLNTNRVKDAERRMERMVKIAPNDAAAHLLLGRITALTGKTHRSIVSLRRAMELFPGDVSLWLEVIALMGQQKRPADAEIAAQAAIRLFPDEADLYLQAGLAWLNNGDLKRARFWVELALQVNPNHPPALYQLAGLEEADLRFGRALRAYQRAKELDVHNQLNDYNFGDLMLRTGQLDAAIATLSERVQAYPHDMRASAAYMMALQYQPGITIPALRDAHQHWESRFGAPLRSTWQPHQVDRDPQRKLRVGLVSGDLRNHPVGFFTVGGIESLDRGQIHLACYTDQPSRDPIALRFRARANVWRDTKDWTDDKLAQQIRDDKIDILIDMAGHTSDIRLLTFARKPAPVQLSWAGYFGTTGAAAIDGLLLDPTLALDGDDALYHEKLWRMPDGYLCYDAPAKVPEAAPRGTPETIRLAAFHNPAKLNPDVVALWARVIKALAPLQVELCMTYHGYEDEEVQQRLIGWFGAHGVGAESLSFCGWLSRSDYFAALNQMDIGLDPFPYSGGAITCDALWMGVPVITLPGATVAGRHSASHLHAAGLDQFIARDEDDYVAKVVGLATDRAALADLHANLRATLAASALCDKKRFAANFAAVMRNVWRDYLAGSVEQA